MNKDNKSYINIRQLRPIIFALCVMWGLMASAAPKASVTANLDSTTLLMGEVTRLNLQVDKPSDVKGYFPLFNDGNSGAYVTLLGDTIELSKSITSDTARLSDGFERITYHVPVQVYDSGYYQIPGLQYVAGSDTLLSNEVTLNVVPVKASATDSINDYTDVSDPAPGSWLDKVPDWVLNYWWAILLGIIVITVSAIMLRRWLKQRSAKPKLKPVLPPYEEAVQALGSLKSKELWQHGENELYFVELTNILRRYLSRRFGVSAPEMTTSQFLAEASSNPKLSDYNAELRRLLELADFIKFAKGQSLPGENEEAFAIVRKFVEDTRPTKEELEAEKQAARQNAENAESKSQNKKKLQNKPTKNAGKKKGGRK